LALKTGEVQVGFGWVALREAWRIFFGEFSGIIIIIIIIIISFSLSCCCSLNYYCVEPFAFEWYFGCV
jgi:hypothetical protein